MGGVTRTKQNIRDEENGENDLELTRSQVEICFDTLPLWSVFSQPANDAMSSPQSWHFRCLHDQCTKALLGVSLEV